MASTYALPILPDGGNRYVHHFPGHGHSRSRSSSGGQHRLPNREASTIASSYDSHGSSDDRSAPNGGLYTHAEISRETSPLPSNPTEHSHSPAFDPNQSPYRANGSLHHHPSQASLHSMKSRPRGESDLGRAVFSNQPTGHGMSQESTGWFSLSKAVTSLLIPLPYVLASAAHLEPFLDLEAPPASAIEKLQHSVFKQDVGSMGHITNHSSAFVEACMLTSGSLLLVGILGKIQSSESAPDRKGEASASAGLDDVFRGTWFSKITSTIFGVGLPFYAATHLGGARVGLVLLVSCATEMMGPIPAVYDWRHVLKTRIASLCVILLSATLDLSSMTSAGRPVDIIWGYLALLCSIFLVRSPLSGSTAISSAGTASTTASQSWSQGNHHSPLIFSAKDVNATLLSGIVMSLVTVVFSMAFSTSFSTSSTEMAFWALSQAAFTCAVFFARPSTLHSRSTVEVGLGCLLTATAASFFSPVLWPGAIYNVGVSILSFFGVLYDTFSAATFHQHNELGDESAYNVHKHHHHRYSGGNCSAFTKYILDHCEPGSLFHDILSEKDSRRIAYFTVLNFAFMLVQGVYGYLSGSLGLLSDTVHMFFDCLGLIVGLGAAVASKWPTSPEQPYGWGKLNTLAGFGNGIFLMLVSIEFIWEAIEGILEQKQLRHVTELLVVSSLGFVINLVGLLAFGHAHAGHDHGHSHDHSHKLKHERPHGDLLGHDHNHDHGHDHSHKHSNGHLHSASCDYTHPTEPQSHGHDHHNDNMHGIFLHVAADAGGSLAVIISTALTLWKPWYLWDPLATIIIAFLIFAAAVPLVTTSGQKLLLVIPNEHEYNIKNTLQELGELRGVIGYAVPRFWLDDNDEDPDSHGHDHHDHDHHDHSGHTHDSSSRKGKKKILGVVHIIAAQGADLEDVRYRVETFTRDRNMDLVIHVEREAEGESQCWCGGVNKTT